MKTNFFVINCPIVILHNTEMDNYSYQVFLVFDIYMYIYKYSSSNILILEVCLLLL